MEHLHPKFKTIHIQGHPVKVKYSAVSNTDTLRAIQSITNVTTRYAIPETVMVSLAMVKKS